MEKIELKNVSGKVFYTVEFNRNSNLIFADWIGYLSVEDVQQGAETYLEVLRETRCPHLINDNRKVLGTWDKANDWIADYWTPRALNLGIKNFAHIVSPSIFAEISAKNMEVRVENAGFTMRTFKDFASASLWIKAQIEQGKLVEVNNLNLSTVQPKRFGESR